jgi:hypothetical protein
MTHSGIRGSRVEMRGLRDSQDVNSSGFAGSNKDKHLICDVEYAVTSEQVKE